VALKNWVWQNAAGELIQARQGDLRKIALASVLKNHTDVSNE
jgi:hypothetical protein